MEMQLGPIPPGFISNARFEEQCFTTEGLVKNATEFENTTLEDTVSDTLPSAEERQDFVCFLRSMLKYSPSERATAQQLLGHPWLTKEYECPQFESY
ncbi:MAG: hypothetical protein Q9176_004429 [Flavoplaca citrina]